MCALTPMFSNKQQELYYASAKMEYPWMSQLESLSPTLHFPSFLYPSFSQPNETKNDNINPMSLSDHSNGTKRKTHDGQADEQEIRGAVLEKKLSHNANERHRRRKLNALYSSLRALLPPSNDQKRTQSIPMTVDRVVKYIPEQRQELQRLSRRKEELLKRISRKPSTLNHHREQLRDISTMDSSSPHFTTQWLSDTEISVQIATSKWTSISHILLMLEENNFSVISISSSVSSTTKRFYTLHLQMKEDCRVRLKELNGGLNQSY